MCQQNCNILIVDDEPDICWALKILLSRQGYSLSIAQNCSEGLAYAKGKSFRIAFIDAKLPDRDGLELAKELREVSPETTVVILSGYFYDDDVSIQSGIENGVIHGFIAKPLQHAQILDWVRRAQSG